MYAVLGALSYLIEFLKVCVLVLAITALIIYIRKNARK